jgi:hypothetical protein
MRKPVTSGIVCFICLIALAVDRIALGQAGSTGGTLGKTDKSVSGGEESPKSSQRHRGKSVGRNHVFVNPTVGGVRVDRCLHDAQECGGYAAGTEFCRTKGFTRAADWKVESLPRTIILLDGHECSGRPCDGFSEIVCE